MRLVILILVFFHPTTSALANNIPQNKSLSYLPVSVLAIKNNSRYKEEIVQPALQNIFQAANKPGDDSLADAGIKRKAKWAKWLGIGSLAGLLIPGINLLSIPAAIAAIVISHQIPKESKYNKEADTGRKTGWLTIGVLFVIGFIVLLVTLPFGVR